MGKGRCESIAGAYRVESCQGANALALPAPGSPSGELGYFLGFAAEGSEVTLGQTACGAFTVAYGGTTTELALGKRRLAGSGHEVGGETTTTQKVSWNWDSLRIETRAVYTYVPVISVWTSKADWELSRQKDGSIEVDTAITDMSPLKRASCRLVPVTH